VVTGGKTISGLTEKVVDTGVLVSVEGFVSGEGTGETGAVLSALRWELVKTSKLCKSPESGCSSPGSSCFQPAGCFAGSDLSAGRKIESRVEPDSVEG